MTAGWIVTDPDILGGKPCIRGTRLSVEFLLELAGSGASQNEILTSYPHNSPLRLGRRRSPMRPK